MTIRNHVVLGVFFALLWSHLATAADPGVVCEAGKLKEAGKYGNCRLKADSKAVKRGEPADYSKCESKFSDKWQKTESKAAGTCPSNEDESSMDARITGDAAEIATLLAGGSVATCGDGLAEGDESCDGADLAGQDCVSLGFASGTLGCTAGCGWDISGCAGSTCGDGVIDPGEDCDLEPGGLGGETCLSQGQLNGGLLHCGAGCQFDYSGCNGFKRVFLTSTSYNGNLGGVAGADAICQAQANFAGIPGTFKAWISTDGPTVTDPATTFTHSTTPYIRLDGVVVADDWADLTDGTLDAPINVDEFGAATTANGAMTSTLPNGTAIVIPSFSFDCNEWTDGTFAGEGFTLGLSDNTDSSWSNFQQLPTCDPFDVHLYCFEQ